MTRDDFQHADRPVISLVVLDFDDTLYDWIGHFMPALDAMIEAAAPLLGAATADLRDQLKAVHERRGNTEHPFALLETASAQARFGHLPRAEQKEALASAFAAFDRVRAEKLKLYDDVDPALARLRSDGVAIVGYSAATSVNIAKRVKMLGLGGSFDRIYAAPYAGMPYPGHGSRTADDPAIIELARSKPDPHAVARITADMGVAPESTLFVGDSIASDIAPAVQGGAKAALIRRDSGSVSEWLPGLLDVSHRHAETRADSAGFSDEALSQTPTMLTLDRLWDHFSFGSPKTLPVRLG
ncbi:MAG: HAD family hydrolase [Bifidobacteriaceae bacterium]|jgi:phosphoglycolate phosphatase|nr:HAD family hydrolase [Bifidobacteriaceae bacterium]